MKREEIIEDVANGSHLERRGKMNEKVKLEEIPEEILPARKIITWRNCRVSVSEGKVDMTRPTLLSIEPDPQDFIDFALTLRDAIEATKLPEPPKPRKTRSDKGKSKKSLANETAISEPDLPEPPLKAHLTPR